MVQSLSSFELIILWLNVGVPDLLLKYTNTKQYFLLSSC